MVQNDRLVYLPYYYIELTLNKVANYHAWNAPCISADGK